MTRRSHADVEKKNSFFVHAHVLYYRSFARMAHKLTDDDFRNADSFKARDELVRVFAAECYQLAEKFASEQQPKMKLSLQYAKLAARLLGLSLRPKKLADLDEIKKALAELKAQEKTE